MVISNGAAGNRVGTPSRTAVIGVWLWLVAAVASMTLLVVAVVGRDRGDGPTLRAMAASESMSDAQARAVADNTVRVWLRERDALHLANVEALSCPDSRGGVAAAIGDLKAGLPAHKAAELFSTGGFSREGTTWMLNAHFAHINGVMFVMEVRDGELRVCDIGSAPVP